MMRRIILGFVTIFGALGASVQADELIVSGQWFSLSSKVMNEDRPYAVYLPPSYQANEDASYPVLYVLDGDETRLRGISGLVESLSTENLEGQIPEFIIVAIPNKDRIRDLTPTNSNIVFQDRITDEWTTSGGADKFLNFFTKDLIPHIENEYRTNDIRTLVGSSYGGLFAWNAFLKRNEVFTHYLIADSNYIWDANVIGRIADEALADKPDLNGKVFVSFANNVAFGEMGAANYGWGRALEKKLSDNGATIHSRYFEDETHGTAELLPWYYGLLDLFGNKE